MGREFEIKYAATGQAFQSLQAAFGPFTRIAMETTYFDTADHALSQRKMTLRLRRENDETICTLKTPLPDGSRGEWECSAADLSDGIGKLIALGAPARLLADHSRFQIVCGARFTRLAAAVPTADGMAELALDQGVLLGGGREIPLWEVELELKSGSDAALLALARQLEETYHLQPEAKSKFARAMELSLGE